MLLLLAALVISQPVVSHAYKAPPPDLAGTTNKPIAVAQTDTGAVACWNDSPRVLCAQVGVNGALGEPVVLESTLPGGSQAQPAIAWNGSELLVAFEDLGVLNRLVVTRLDRDLRPLAPPRFVTYLPGVGPGPAVAWNGKQWLVSARASITRFSPKLDSATTTSDAAPIIDSAAAGSRFVTVHPPTSRLLSCSGFSWPHCSTITEWTGSILEADPALPPGSLMLMTPAPASASFATLASGPRNALLVWSDGVSVFAGGLDRNLAGSRIVAVVNGNAEVRAETTESGSLVVWSERGDVRGIFLESDDTPDGQPFVIAATAAQERHPAPVALGNGNWAVIYEVDGKLVTRVLLTQPIRRRSR